MEAKKILDLTTPDITAYPLYANPIAIMQCYSETREWLLSNCIQLCSNSKVLNFYDFNYKCCPFLDVQRILVEQLKYANFEWIPFITQCLKHNRYVYIMIKKRYINAYYPPNSSYRQSDESIHDILIYGYDDGKKTFYIADNFIWGKYFFSECSYADMLRAIVEVSPEEALRTRFKGAIELITYTGNDAPDLSVRRIYESLDDYYNGKPTGMWNIMEVRNYNRNRNWYFGFMCYEYLLIKISETDFNNLTIHDFHLLWEHKKHIKKIIEYLLEKKYIYDKSFLTQIDRIIDLSLVARNLVLKALMSKDNSIRPRIVVLYQQMENIEKSMLFHLLRELQLCDMERLMYQNNI